MMTYQPEQPQPSTAPKDGPAAAPPAAIAPPRQQEPLPPTASGDAPLNTYISDNLNAADQLFKSDLDGCSNVSMAIAVANSPGIYGPTGQAQKEELRRYARRCNLRF